MRIAMIVSAPLPAREGMGFYVWNLSRHLTEMGHKVHIITRGRAGSISREEVNGITIWRPTFLPIYPFHVHLHGLFVRRLIQHLEPEVDLFHVHSPLPPVLPTRRPLILTVHSAVREDVKLTTVDSVYTFLMRLQAPISYWLEKELLRKATSVNTVSPQVAEVLRKYPTSPAEIKTTWNGVDTELFKPARDYTRSERFVLAVGRLAPGKGLEDLLQAAVVVNQKLGPTRFVVVGDGSLRQLLQKKILKEGLGQHVELLGYVANRNQLAELYARASLFVIASHHEGLPTVVLEALACGCPVVATGVGGIPYVVVPGENGLLVPPRDPQQMADAICKLLQDPLRLQYMATQARQTVEKQFSWNAVSRNHLTQYESLLQGAAL